MNRLSQVLEAVSRLLCDLDDFDQAFGGKMMVLGGDWKQLLPVVKQTYGRDILDYTLKKSPLWQGFQVRNCSPDTIFMLFFQTLTLSKNMRLESGAEEFAEFLNKVGTRDASVHNGERTI